jgi:hypothetical protein
MRIASARLWQTAALLCAALLLASIAGYYDPGVGFTTLLGLAKDGHERETPALQAIPHHHNPPQQAYDGGQYVQLALDPLLQDPAIDRALDNPAYRARRILFSWTAWAAGVGRPAWIVQAYAVQNVVLWFVLAAVMTLWLRPANARLFALWFAVMFSDGLLASMRLSLLDGPSMLLLALAVAAAERNRPWTSAAIVGVAGLGRETNLLGAVSLPLPEDRRGWLRTAGALVVVMLPLLIWQDYVWSIYRTSSATEGIDHITPPLVAYAQKWQTTLSAVTQQGLWSYQGRTLLIVIALTTQVGYVARTRDWRNPWWRLAAAYAVLLFVVDSAVWEGTPGAITRVVLPLTCGFNVLLRKESRAFWPWYVAGNLHLVQGIDVLLDTATGW